MYRSTSAYDLTLMLRPCRLLRWHGSLVGDSAKIGSQHEYQEHADDQWGEGNHPEGESLEAQVHKKHRHQAGFSQSHSNEQNGFQPRRIGWESDNDFEDRKGQQIVEDGHVQGLRVVLSHNVPLRHTLDQVDKGKDHDPHQIDKMPVETSNLDRVVIIGGIRPAHASEQDAEQVDHATRDVHTMETSNDEKGRAEQRRPIGIASEPQPFMENELVPLIGLAAQKDHATEDR